MITYQDLHKTESFSKNNWKNWHEKIQNKIKEDSPKNRLFSDAFFYEHEKK
jgi:hypothetical protein